jgi:hypothetical protein
MLRCLIPTEKVIKYNLAKISGIGVRFSKFKKKIVSYTSRTNVTFSVKYGMQDESERFPLIQLDDFELVNPIEFRLNTKMEMKDAQKLRDEILFPYDSPSNHIRMSFHHSIFLSHRISARSGVETKGLIEDRIPGRALINLDSQDNLAQGLIPDEISNSQSKRYRGDYVKFVVPGLMEAIDIPLNYPEYKYHFNSSCTPNQREDTLSSLRSTSNDEIGIIHQTKFFTYGTRKALLDKMASTEFFYVHDDSTLPQHSIHNYEKSKKLLAEHKEDLFNDYVSRLYRPIATPVLTTEEKQRMRVYAEEIVENQHYKIKQGPDSYVSSVVRTLQEKLYIVKGILQRNDYANGENIGMKYLEDFGVNMSAVLDSSGFKGLNDQAVDMEKITKIFNNELRRNIVESLKIRGGSANREDILNDARAKDIDENKIIRELENLEKGGFVYIVNGIVTLDDFSI